MTNLEEIRRKAMEMRTFRGPSAEDHQHDSSAPDDSKITTSMTSIMTPDDTVITRKCCTLCNLLVCRLSMFEDFEKNSFHFSVSI